MQTLLATLEASTLYALGILGCCLFYLSLVWLRERSQTSTSAPGGENAREEFIEQLNAVLPQTQCGQCGHLGCRPYAEAIADGSATNQCPPGGEITARRLARLCNEHPQALAPNHLRPLSFAVARIREDECIGCTKCIQACPTDAIFGASKRMHSVIESECNGCDLCVEPCPVDCIDLIPRGDDAFNTQRRAGGRP